MRQPCNCETNLGVANGLHAISSGGLQRGAARCIPPSAARSQSVSLSANRKFLRSTLPLAACPWFSSSARPPTGSLVVCTNFRFRPLTQLRNSRATDSEALSDLRYSGYSVTATHRLAVRILPEFEAAGHPDRDALLRAIVNQGQQAKHSPPPLVPTGTDACRIGH